MQSVKLNIHVKPNSTKGPLIEALPDKSLVIYIREIATKGQANDAVLKLLAKHYSIPKNNIKIIHGHTSRHKIAKLELLI